MIDTCNYEITVARRTVVVAVMISYFIAMVVKLKYKI